MTLKKNKCMIRLKIVARLIGEYQDYYITASYEYICLIISMYNLFLLVSEISI